MSANPLVSIILPVCNGERYIGAAVESVLRQTLTDWELRLVDDGSSDATLERVAFAAGDPRVFIVQQANQGLAASRNGALHAARGQWVAFLDADDLWQPTYLARMTTALHQAPGAVLAFSGWQYVAADGARLPQAVVVQPAEVEHLRATLYRRNSMLPATVVAARQQVLAAGGFDTHLRACEDWDLWLRLKPLGAFVAVPEVLVWYRTHTDNMSDDIETMEAMRLLVIGRHAAPLQQSQGRGYAYFLSALAYLRARQNAQGAAKLQAALDLWPGLLEEAELYYELGCAFQPRGYRGTPGGLNVTNSGELVRWLFCEALTLETATARRAWAKACLTLSQLALLAGDRPAGRRFALQALRAGPMAQPALAIRRFVSASVPRPWLAAWRARPARRAAPAADSE